MTDKTAAKERPIIFNGEMVRAILKDLKTQTRRVMKPPPFTNIKHVRSVRQLISEGFLRQNDYEPDKCPYGQPGDRLWVRETWKPVELDEPEADFEGEVITAGTDGTRYRADGAFQVIENTQAASTKWCEARRPSENWPHNGPVNWRPSIHMPRWASRITLEVTGVRVERVQDIRRADVHAEGLPVDTGPQYDGQDWLEWFRELWDRSNAKRYGWDANPWVWVIEFKRIEP